MYEWPSKNEMSAGAVPMGALFLTTCSLKLCDTVRENFSVAVIFIMSEEASYAMVVVAVKST